MTDTVNSTAIYPNLGRSVKLFLNNEIRRFSFNGSSLNELRLLVKQLMGLSHDNFVALYQDDEGDWVTIASDHELNYAWQVIGSQALRIKIEEKNAAIGQASAPVSPTSPRTKEMVKEAKMEYKLVKKEAKMEMKREKMDMKREKLERKFLKKEGKCAKKMDKPFAARFVKHVSVEDNYEFAPGTAFTKIWRFRNEGTAAWPSNTVLLFVGKKGDQMGAPSYVPVSRVVLPGEEIDVAVSMVAPSAPGSYFGYWKLAELDGRKFGQRVRVLIKVAGDSSTSSSDESPIAGGSAWGDKLRQLESMGFTDKGLNVKLIRKTHGDMDKIVAKLLKREQKKSGRVHH